MRNWITRVALVTVLAIAGICVAACSSAEDSGNQAHQTDDSPGFISDTTLRPIDQVSSEDALFAFAANSTMAVLNGPDAASSESGAAAASITEQNLCYSPVSLYLACTLLAEGVQGASQEQLLALLGVTDGAALAEEAQRVRTQLADVYGDAVVEVADSIWSGEEYQFTDAYVQNVQELGGAAFSVPFGTQDADQRISGWVSEQTNGLLSPQISTQLGQAALLINTIYFKDGWANPFEAASTTEDVFNAPGQQVQARYMRQEISDSQYAATERYTAASLGFSGGATMTFVRPNDGVELSELLGSAQDIQNLFTVPLEFQSVDWWLPAFTTDSSLRQLAESLRALGVTDVFSPEAPDAFAPMIATDDGVGFCVSDVRQDTRLALDENGVEAAAVTSIGIMKMALPPEGQPVEFKLDRPFLYYITSADGVVLFVGVVYNPNL